MSKYKSLYDIQRVIDAHNAEEEGTWETYYARLEEIAAILARPDEPEPDTRYNGWTNYATWRVNLEIHGDTAWEDHGQTYADTRELADYLKEETDLLLSDEFGEQLRMDYARSFVSDVNWYELAEAYAADFPDLIESDEDDTEDEGDA